MSYDDIIYLSLLFSSIGFGYYYRAIEDVGQKKKIGSLVGLLVVFIVSGLHLLHPLITVVVNAAFILLLDKKQCHIVSFVFSFLYLFFFRTTIHFGIPYPPAHTNLIEMMMVLKMVGLSLEVNKDETGALKKKLNFMEVFHYAFSYVGVLTGPYYRYQTFSDSFEKPFYKYVDWKKSTLDKIKWVPLFAILFLWATYNWPLSYALTEEFYSERSWLYRYWYIWPNFFIFRMRIFIGLTLSECVCTMAGVGVYPKILGSKPGHGPNENQEEVEEWVRKNDQKKLSSAEYDHETIHNIDPYGTEFVITYREAMKHWNICIQYWLVVNVYQKFPVKSMRTNVTMVISAMWHGVYTGYYVCIATVPLALLVEDVWIKVLRKDRKFEGVQEKLVNFVIWFFRLQLFSYQAIAFHLLELGVIWKYYNSIYHVGLLCYVLLYVIGLQLAKKGKRLNKKTEDQEQTLKAD